MEFKSQICTTREQSERLVAMGLKPETADMMWDAITVIRGRPVQEVSWSLRPYYYPKKSSILYDNEEQVFIPAWSMSRLMEMAESDIQTDGSTYVSLPAIGFSSGESLYDNLIDCIKWLIEQYYFPSEYITRNESKD